MAANTLKIDLSYLHFASVFSAFFRVLFVVFFLFDFHFVCRFVVLEVQFVYKIYRYVSGSLYFYSHSAKNFNGIASLGALIVVLHQTSHWQNKRHCLTSEMCDTSYIAPSFSHLLCLRRKISKNTQLSNFCVAKLYIERRYGNESTLEHCNCFS